MNKKIVLINGSPRKKTTFHYPLQLDKLFQQKGLDTEIIHLKDKNINQCSGCEVCITKGICIQKDDMKNLRNLIKSADGMVLSSPVYLRSISGLLKNFIDRTCDYYHRTELAGKPVLSLVTTAASGVKETQGYLKDVIIQWGSVPSGIISRSLKTARKRLLKKF